MENQNRNKLARKNRQQRLVLERDELRAEIARLTRERDEAVRVAVWAVKWRACMADAGRSLMWVWVDDEAYSIPCDGTDADIYHALREAMGASEGGNDRED